MSIADDKRKVKIVLGALERYKFDHLRNPETDEQREHLAVIQVEIDRITKWVYMPEPVEIDTRNRAEEPIHGVDPEPEPALLAPSGGDVGAVIVEHEPEA